MRSAPMHAFVGMVRAASGEKYALTRSAPANHDCAKCNQRERGRFGNGGQGDVRKAVRSRYGVRTAANRPEVHEGTYEVIAGRKENAVSDVERVRGRVSCNCVAHVAPAPKWDTRRRIANMEPNDAATNSTVELVGPFRIERKQRVLSDMEVDAIVCAAEWSAVSTLACQVSVDAKVAGGQAPVELVSGLSQRVVQHHRPSLCHGILELIDVVGGVSKLIGTSDGQRAAVHDDVSFCSGGPRKHHKTHDYRNQCAAGAASKAWSCFDLNFHVFILRTVSLRFKARRLVTA